MPLPIWPAPTTPIRSIFICCYSPLIQRTFEFGERLKQIGHEAIIRNPEYRRVLILVDGHNHFGVLHACQMLNGAGNPDRDVEFRGDDFSRLTNLVVIWNETGIDGRARVAH